MIANFGQTIHLVSGSPLLVIPPARNRMEVRIRETAITGPRFARNSAPSRRAMLKAAHASKGEILMSAYDVFLLVSFGILLVAALVLFLPMRRTRPQPEAPRDRQTSDIIFRDDDQYWRGFFYYNPDDPEPFVPKRYGWGWSLNFAHPAAKAIIGALVVILLLPIVLAIFGLLPATGCHPSGCTAP